jgi:hypothetical protein
MARDRSSSDLLFIIDDEIELIDDDTGFTVTMKRLREE